MGPKGKEPKKGAVAGNFKGGKSLKDILPIRIQNLLVKVALLALSASLN